MSVTATIGLTMQVVETVGVDAAGAVDATKNSVTFSKLGVASTSLGAATTPTANIHAVGQQALTAGAASIDLTALTGLNGVAVSLNAKTLRAVLFQNPAANANAITIAKGAANGYTGFGATYSETLQPGQTKLVYLAAAGTAVSGTVKTLDITGTGAQVLNYEIVAG